MLQTLDYAQDVRSSSANATARTIVFSLAATSIWSLLVEFYGLMSMRTFALWVCVPSMIALLIWAILDRGEIRRMIWIGAVAGLLAACAYDVFRLPFVFAREWHIDSVVPALPLFKVFPEFGAGILGNFGIRTVSSPRIVRLIPFMEHARAYSLTEHLVGWAYHLSNGITFGIMYLALIGDAVKRSWIWAVLFAVGLEIALLVTPYASFFGIAKTPTFILVTLSAHAVFGVVMGISARWMWARRPAR
jgi:hypothetical protein